MKPSQQLSTFRYVLKRLRIEKALTQELLSERLGINASFVAQMETGRKYPSLEMLFRIAEALEIPASEILNIMERESLRG